MCRTAAKTSIHKDLELHSNVGRLDLDGHLATMKAYSNSNIASNGPPGDGSLTGDDRVVLLPVWTRPAPRYSRRCLAPASKLLSVITRVRLPVGKLKRRLCVCAVYPNAKVSLSKILLLCLKVEHCFLDETSRPGRGRLVRIPPVHSSIRALDSHEQSVKDIWADLLVQVGHARRASARVHGGCGDTFPSIPVLTVYATCQMQRYIIAGAMN